MNLLMCISIHQRASFVNVIGLIGFIEFIGLLGLLEFTKRVAGYELRVTG